MVRALRPLLVVAAAAGVGAVRPEKRDRDFAFGDHDGAGGEVVRFTHDCRYNFDT